MSDALVIRGVGCDCGPGWHGIIRDLDAALSAIAPDYVLLDVKEKYGRLCFDTGGLPMEGHDLVNAAEAASAKTCERCGEPGETSGSAWLRTLCAKCRGGVPGHQR